MRTVPLGSLTSSSFHAIIELPPQKSKQDTPAFSLSGPVQSVHVKAITTCPTKATDYYYCLFIPSGDFKFCIEISVEKSDRNKRGYLEVKNCLFVPAVQ